jgi:pyruvate, orthophosphate dikinase
VFSADEAEKQARAGEKVILVRRETSPEDIHGMHAAEGILTSTGGMTSHAAVVARGMGKPCVAGAGDVRIDGSAGTLSVRGTVVKAGEFMTLDGSTGEIMLGVVPTVQPELSGDFAELMEWADEFRTLGIRANAETPADAAQARKFGAEGIGLCRTEHMFFEGDRVVAVRQMILADDEKSRRAALAKIQPMQRQDFVGLFEIMAGLPVTIRLLDPPLHEFLPKTHADMEVVAKDLGVAVAEIEARANKLHEFNPMLGHRGVRLGISYPEIYEMQARAIFEAVVEVQKKAGKTVIPEIMIPLVATKRELDLMKVVIDQVASEVSQLSGEKLEYLTGTMIELPRAALRAGDIAESADFFSFGTNDLTQTALGFSRDDVESAFVPTYIERRIIDRSPFETIDTPGVGWLVRLASWVGRESRPDLKLGVCGEHGGDPTSIEFFHSAWLDYVSCSPYRVPVARIAAAQAAIRHPRAPMGVEVG